MSGLVILTDLDGCLLNKHDYDYSAALPTLARIAQCGVPLVLCSSKTEAEMLPLADELGLIASPITCENGAAVVWRDNAGNVCERSVLGADRDRILTLLGSLHQQFRFRSFTDLEIRGIMETTGLDRDRATAANDRHCTEPLVWADKPEAIDAFRKIIEANDLTLTRGGRFWHVAGHTTKGAAMKLVLERYQSETDQAVRSVAIGDSPIDQSMLDIADYSIGIPAPDGCLNVTVSDGGIVASQPGALGWAESVGEILDRLGYTN